MELSHNNMLDKLMAVSPWTVYSKCDNVLNSTSFSISFQKQLQSTSVITNPDITNLGSSELILVVPSKRNRCLFIIIYIGYNELRLYHTDFAGPLGVRYNRS